MRFYEWVSSFLSGQRLSWLYVCYAVPIGLFLILATPPFQTPDSINHFFRAIQISEGHFLSERAGNTSGGPIDESVVGFTDIFFPMAARPAVKFDASMAARAAGRKWGGNKRVVEFPGTAIYPAYAYLPQVVTIGIARAIGVSVPATYRLTCIVDLLVSIALTVAALLLARRTALWIFAVALLPSTLMLYSSVSQEVLLVPVCFLLIAALDRALDERKPVERAPLFGVVLVAVACITARPPYVGLLLLLFCPALVMVRVHNDGPNTDRHYGAERRIVWLFAAVLACSAVIVMSSRSAWAPVPPPRSEAGQIAWLLHNPLEIGRVAWTTLRQNGVFYFESMIGVLGWLDTHMHKDYYRASGVMGLALVAVTLLERRGAVRAIRPADRLIVALALLTSIAMIFGALYVSWTPVGRRVVDGVQGRYFLPLLPLLALLLPARSSSGAESRALEALKVTCVAIVLIFPIYTFTETIEAMLSRFYL
ncbi:MAG TPA: DUF2142 domain-containing protein [Paraburkholderia sp.]|uniref:DUF2142 domain-containing protein n=1 Tax=Paraburkholderia sp. TaxID=1926495 RepID=UPI002B47AFDF|nr:DUF2142 domain-containing protein [Paraburkholderia sp.]HKR47017.1 DUF2142 domain-containing protein [Paraburkholderia sp.]